MEEFDRCEAEYPLRCDDPVTACTGIIPIVIEQVCQSKAVPESVYPANHRRVKACGYFIGYTFRESGLDVMAQ